MDIIFGVVIVVLVISALFKLISDAKTPAERIALSLVGGDESKVSAQGSAGVRVMLGSSQLSLSSDEPYQMKAELVLPLEHWPYFLSFEHQADRFKFLCGDAQWTLSWAQWCECFGQEAQGLELFTLSSMRLSGEGDGGAAQWVMRLSWSVADKALITKQLSAMLSRYRGFASQLERWFVSPQGVERLEALARDADQELGLRRLCVSILAASARDARVSSEHIELLYDELWARGELTLYLSGLDRERALCLSDERLEALLAYLVDQPALTQEVVGALIASRITPEQLVSVVARSAYLRFVIVNVWRDERRYDDEVIYASLEALAAGLSSEQLRKLLAMMLVWHGPDYRGLMEQLRMAQLDCEGVALFIRLLERHYTFRANEALTEPMVYALLHAMRRSNRGQLSALERIMSAHGTAASAKIIREELAQSEWLDEDAAQACRRALSALSQRLGLGVHDGGLTLLEDESRAGALSQVQGEQGGLKIME